MPRTAFFAMLVTLLAACSAATPGTVAPSASPASAETVETTEPVSPSASSPAVTVAPTPVGAQLPSRGAAPVAVEAGRYAMPPWFRTPLSLEIGDGWRGIRDDKAKQVTLVRGTNEVGHATDWLGLYAIPTVDVAAFVAELRTTPRIAFEDAAPTEIAGMPAEQFDGRAELNPEEPGSDRRVAGTVDIPAMRLVHSPGITDFAWYTESPEAHLRIVFADVGDNTLILYIEAPADGFDAFVGLLDEILASVVIG